MAFQRAPRVLLSLPSQDKVPEWITHVLLADDRYNVIRQGEKSVVLRDSATSLHHQVKHGPSGSSTGRSALLYKMRDDDAVGERVVEFEGVKVQYGHRTVLGDWKQAGNGKGNSGLWWTVRRGERWGLFGPNGT